MSTASATPERAPVARTTPPSPTSRRRTYENGGVLRRRRSVSTVERSLELVRNVVEGRAQLRADALHRGDSGNGDEGGNQAVFNRGRTLAVTNQFQKLGHL